jgi:hypothetical protein
MADEMSNHFGICVRGKARASRHEFLTQLAMIFDDAVVNDRNAINRMWMRIFFVWTTMSRPTRVADSYAANKRLTSELALEILELSDCAPPRKATAIKRGYTSGIVTPIFKPFQRVENRHHGWPLADETNDSAHLLSPFSPPSDCGIEPMPAASNHRVVRLPSPNPL